MPIEQFLSLLQHSSGKASRSTALQPVGVIAGILAVTLALCVRFEAERQTINLITYSLIAVVTVYLCSYIYLILTNIDATRSERFNLEKMALQQSRTGDDRVGFIEGSVNEHNQIPSTVQAQPTLENGDGDPR